MAYNLSRDNFPSHVLLSFSKIWLGSRVNLTSNTLDQVGNALFELSHVLHPRVSTDLIYCIANNRLFGFVIIRNKSIQTWLTCRRFISTSHTLFKTSLVEILSYSSIYMHACSMNNIFEICYSKESYFENVVRTSLKLPKVE